MCLFLTVWPFCFFLVRCLHKLKMFFIFTTTIHLFLFLCIFVTCKYLWGVCGSSTVGLLVWSQLLPCRNVPEQDIESQIAPDVLLCMLQYYSMPWHFVPHYEVWLYGTVSCSRWRSSKHTQSVQHVREKHQNWLSFSAAHSWETATNILLLKAH